jgi:hypothetical protein
MKTFEQICRNIDWNAMAKARISVKNLMEKKPQLKPLADFLDALSETAVEVHGVKLNTVYPNSIKAMLIDKQLKNKN